MTQAEKLEALVRKAKENGQAHRLGDCVIATRTGELDNKITTEPYIIQYRGVDRQLYREMSWQVFVYDKEIARALFGDGEGGDYYKINDPKRTRRKLWEHMLQQAVISDDPIDYMYNAVFGGKHDKNIS